MGIHTKQKKEKHNLHKLFFFIFSEKSERDKFATSPGKGKVLPE